MRTATLLQESDEVKALKLALQLMAAVLRANATKPDKTDENWPRTPERAMSFAWAAVLPLGRLSQDIKDALQLIDPHMNGTYGHAAVRGMLRDLMRASQELAYPGA